MQTKDEIIRKKKLILRALAEVVKEFRGNQSQFKLSSENDISIDIISKCERGLKDPQLTTIFKLAEAFSVSPDVFVACILEKLPKDFYMIDK